MPAKSTQSAGVSNRERMEDLLLGLKRARLSSVSDVDSLAKELIRLAQQEKDQNLEGLGCLELSAYHCSSTNEYDKALELAEKGFGLMKGSFKQKHHPHYQLAKGRCYQFLGDQPAAQSCYLDAISLLEKTNDKDRDQIHWQAACYYNAYILFNQSGMEFTREDFLEKAHQLYGSIDDFTGLSNIYNSYASSAFKRGDKKEALDNLLKAYELAGKESAHIQLSIYASNIGLLYAQQGDTSAIREYFDKAKEHTRATKSRYHEAHMNGQMGEALIQLGLEQEGLDRLHAASEILQEINASASLTGVFQKLADVYAGMGDFKNAYTYQLRYSQLLRERFKEEKTSAIAKARMFFNLEEKEKETALLRQKNEEINSYMEELRYSNEELKQFAYVVSHDLREPLRTISSYIKLLERSLAGKLDKDEREYIDFVVTGSRNMNELISDLLTFSKISFVTDVESIDLNNLVRQLADETIMHYRPEKHADIRIDTLPEIRANLTQMKQLFKNLLSNAVKYNSNQVPQVAVGYKEQDTYHVFNVADNGIGIPKEFHERVFQIFQRLHSKSEYQGTGVGLAICKKVVDQLKGDISIRSNEDGGSNFTIRIPKQSVSS